jgi:poly-beta-hydroxyalkanoate depolymerase
MPQNISGRRQTASFRRRVPSGHIGLFLGARTLKEHWPQMGPVDRRPVNARIIAQIQSGRTGDVHGLGQLGAAHDLLGSIPIGRRQDDLGALQVFLLGVAIPDDGLQPKPILGRDSDADPCSA